LVFGPGRRERKYHIIPNDFVCLVNIFFIAIISNNISALIVPGFPVPIAGGRGQPARGGEGAGPGIGRVL